MTCTPLGVLSDTQYNRYPRKHDSLSLSLSLSLQSPNLKSSGSVYNSVKVFISGIPDILKNSEFLKNLNSTVLSVLFHTGLYDFLDSFFFK